VSAKAATPTEVELWYAHERLRAIWRGTLEFPYSVPVPRSRTTTPVVIETATTPGWIVALAGGLGGLVLLLGLLLLLLVRRRRREAPEPSAAAAVAVVAARSGEAGDSGAEGPGE
jgi:LPXTG-motif cell wall-anchored protein